MEDIKESIRILRLLKHSMEGRLIECDYKADTTLELYSLDKGIYHIGKVLDYIIELEMKLNCEEHDKKC